MTATLVRNGIPDVRPLTVTSEQDVRVWLVRLDRDSDAVNLFSRLLSQDEVERARRYRFEHLRRRFIVCRGVLRSLLGNDLGIDGRDVRFTYGLYGKPEVTGMTARAPSFNVSHSDDLALIAIARVGCIGIDIERVRPLSEMEQLAETVFSPAEKSAWRELPDEQRTAGFFAAWARKEAYIKARGEGLQLPLANFDVVVAPDAPARLLRVAGAAAEVARWELTSLAPHDSYASAVCVEGSGRRIVQNW